MKLQDIKLTPATHFTYFYLHAAKKFYPLMDVALEEVCESVEDQEGLVGLEAAKGVKDTDSQGPMIDDMKLYHYVKGKINLLHKSQIDEFSSYIEKEFQAILTGFSKESGGDLKMDFKNLIQIDFYKGIKCIAITVPKSTPKFMQELTTMLKKKLGMSKSQMSTEFCSLLISLEAVKKSMAVLKPIGNGIGVEVGVGNGIGIGIGIEKMKKDTKEMSSTDSDEICQFLNRHFGTDYSLAKPDVMYRLKINSLENSRDLYVAKLNALLNGAIKLEHYSTRDTKYIKIVPEVIAIIKQKNKNHQGASKQEFQAAQVMLKDKLPMKFV